LFMGSVGPKPYSFGGCIDVIGILNFSHSSFIKSKFYAKLKFNIV
jgi:hypothetical protein